MADAPGQDSEEALLSAVLEHYNRGNLGEAQQLCLRLLQRNPRNARALHLDGQIALARGDARAARDQTASGDSDVRTATGRPWRS